MLKLKKKINELIRSLPSYIVNTIIIGIIIVFTTSIVFCILRQWACWCTLLFIVFILLDNICSYDYTNKFCNIKEVWLYLVIWGITAIIIVIATINWNAENFLFLFLLPMITTFILNKEIKS